MLKNTMKILGVIFVIGLVLVTIGMMLGGGKYSAGNNKNNESQIVSESQKNIEQFDSIIVDAANCDVIIVEDDYYGFDAQNSYGANINWTVEKGVFTIGEQVEKSFNFDFDFFDREVENYIKVFVPIDAAIKNIDVNSISGDVRISKTKGDNVNLKLLSGDVDIEQCDFNNLEVSSTSGDVDIQHSQVKKSNLDLISGDAKYENVKTEDVVTKSSSGDFDINGEITNSVKVDLISGDAKLDIKGKEADYSFELESMSSEIRIGKNIFEDKVNIQNGSKQIKIDATSGDIEVDFS